MQKAGNILIVDDNREILLSLKFLLKDYFATVRTIATPDLIFSDMKEYSPEVVVLDMNFRAGLQTGNEGLFLLRQIKDHDPGAMVVCITAYGAVDLAVEALKSGAADFVEKPWNEARMITTLLRCAEIGRSRKKINRLEKRQNSLHGHGISDPLTGESAAMQNIMETAAKAAPTDAPVLILGENGTGKEVLARQIHNMSNRSDKVFTPVDMGSLAPTLFEPELFGHVKGAFTGAAGDREGRLSMADGGTLFLDEIGNLQPEQQTKLLTALERKEIVPVGSPNPVKIDIRVISATNSNLPAMVETGIFREDLYYRLNTIVIELPPLRERKEDIPLFARYFTDMFAKKYKKHGISISKPALRKMINYSWPGNIRELRHALERAVILSEGGKVGDEFLFPQTKGITEEKECKILSLEENEKNLIREALRHARGNVSMAAKMLGVSRKTLYNKTSRYDI